MQPRPSEVKKALPPLTYQQEEMLKKAKRYAMEQSVQQVGRLKVFYRIKMCIKLVAADCITDCYVPFQNSTQECISKLIFFFVCMYLVNSNLTVRC